MGRNRLSSLISLGLAALVAGACSESPLRSPVSPSAFTRPDDSATAAPATGARASRAATASWAVDTGWSTAADGVMVEGADAVSAVNGHCPDRVITVHGVPVLVNAATVFVGLSCGGLAPGVSVQIAGLLIVANGNMSVVASEVRTGATPQAPSGPPPNGGNPGGSGKRVGGDGTVASLTGTCPDLSMVVRGTRVRTRETTVFEDGACGNLRPGTTVFVEGDLQDDGSLDATLVRMTDQPGGNGHGRLSGEGTIASVHGNCPAQTMIVRGYAVMTSAATSYTGGACEDLKPGVRVEVTGLVVANSLMAEVIVFK